MLTVILGHYGLAGIVVWFLIFIADGSIKNILSKKFWGHVQSDIISIPSFLFLQECWHNTLIQLETYFTKGQKHKNETKDA